MKILLFCFATVLITSALIVDKTNLKADKTNSYISYHCIHSLHEWTGVNKNINCVMIYDNATNTIEKVAVVGKVGDFDSGNPNRDAHSVEVLEAIQYPNVTFSSTSIAVNGNNLKVTGNLTFHNVTKPVTFDAVREDKNKNISVKGSFSILLTDYKIDRPSFMLMKVEDKMDLSFVMIFNK
jgi:polyisoprenoid-binding protein YceI